MPRRIAINDPHIAALVRELTKCSFDPARDNTIGVVDDSIEPGILGYARGGVIFTDYTTASITVHMGGIGDRWGTRDFLWAVFDYAFNQLGVRRIYGLVEAANERVLNIDIKLGFQFAATLPDKFASGAGVVLYMEREHCRWLDIKPKTIQGGRG